MTKKLRIVADVTSCCGYGACAQLCPEIYALGQGGLVVLKTHIVPEGLENKAIEGAEVCPQMAISIEEFDE